MSNAKPNLILRNDTVLGVCEAIGQDFGFHANWLRLAFGSLFYFAPLAVIGTYLGLGVVVAVSRYVAPDLAEAQPPVSSNVEPVEAEALPLAA